MPADWRPAAIPLTGGLVTGTPAKALAPGQFAQLDNAVFDGVGCPEKRHGSTASTVYYAAAGSQPADPQWVFGHGWAPGDNILLDAPNGRTVGVRGLATRDNTLLAYDGTRMYARAPSDPLGWSPVKTGASFQLTDSGQVTVATPGTIHIPHLTTRHILSSDDEDLPDLGVRMCKAGVVGNSIELYSRIESDTGEVYLYANDVATGTSIMDQHKQTLVAVLDRDTDVLLTYVPPVTGATYGIFVMAQGNRTTEDIVVAWAHEYDPATWTNAVDTSGYVMMAARMTDDYAYIGWKSATDVVTIERIDVFGAVTSFSLGTFADIGVFDFAIHPDGRLMLAWIDTAGATDLVKYSFYAADLTTVTAGPLGTDSDGQDNFFRITCEWHLLSDWRDLDGEPSGVIIAEGEANGVNDGHLFGIYRATATLESFGSGYFSAHPTTEPRMELAGAAFRVGNTICVQARYRSFGAQNQMVVLYFDQNQEDIDQALMPCASWARGLAEADDSTDLARYEVLQPARVVDLVATLPYTTKTPGRITRSLHTATLDFGAPLRSVQAGKSAYFAGAMVWEYDGRSMHEAGFLDVPLPSLAPSVAGAMTPSSTYTYRIYLVHQNAQGEYTRSAAITQTVTLGPGDGGVAITLPPMPLCTRPGAMWEVYRSQANGTVLTRTLINTVAGNVEQYPAYRRHPTGGAVGVGDIQSDATIAANAIDPVPFGVLDNVSPPPCSIITQGKDRVWYSGGDLLPGQVAFSKFWDAGETPAWNEALVVDSDRSGSVTGVGFVGDWVVAFSPTSIFQYAGDGPSNSGFGDFTPARLVSSDTGCVSADSVLLTPLGVAFRSKKGIRVMGAGGALLTAGGGMLGADVDGSFPDSLDCVGACVVAEQDHARWLLTDGTVMVWDYSVNRWARWTGYRLTEYGTPNALRTWQGGMVVAELDQILVEDTSVATDGGRLYRFIASLGWISPHGPLNWGRLRRWSLEGDALGGFTAQVFIDYDFKDGPRRQTYTWAASTSRAGADGTTYDHDPGSWGSDSTWGSSPSWGGDTADGGAFPVNVRFNRQKTTAFRFTITDSTEGNRTLALRTLSIEYAPQAGLVRVGGRNI